MKSRENKIMKKELTCIECPQGCRIVVTLQDKKMLAITGNKCKQGKTYAMKECTYPERVLTSTVVAQDLPLKLVPVKTDKPIPKDRIFDVMEVVHKVCLQKGVKCGDIIVANVCELDVNLVATRSV